MKMSKGKRMTKEEVEYLLSQREKEIEELRETQLYIEAKNYEETQRARAEGYQEAIREVFTLLKDILAKGNNNE